MKDLRLDADEWERICARKGEHDVCEESLTASLMRQAADTIESLLKIVDAARELEAFVWANPGFPEGPPGIDPKRQILQANANKRRELARRVSDAIQVWERDK